MNKKENTRVVVKMETQCKDYLRELSAFHQISLSEWVRIFIKTNYVAHKITERMACSEPTTEQYRGFDKPLFAETPFAFQAPFGPSVALERRSVVPAISLEEELPDVPAEPPVIELLPGSNPGGYWTHVVQPGDSLSGIAAQYYGDPGLYPRIANANNIQPPYIIFVGQILIIPKIELPDVVLASTFTDNCSPWCTYRVQPGDTLCSIAAQYYGDSCQYWRIANCNNIPAPNYTIYIGDIINIPALVV